MKIKVEIADSLSEYLNRWTKAIADVYWFQSRSLFDYAREEMAKEIAREFNQSECIHLLAKSEDSNGVVGALKVKVKQGVGTLGRWEPAVPLKYRRSGVGEALLEEAFSWLCEKRASNVKCMLKFPIGKPQTARWHTRLYQKCGFTKKSPSGIMLQIDLSKVEITRKTIPVASLQIIHGNEFSLKEIAEFTQKAYMTTPEDRAVHQNDPFISNPETVLRTLQAIREGEMGFSPSDCWLVARFKNNIAGFIIGFMPKSRYRPAHGVIGELGVFPEYRREGIATALIRELFKSFRKLECEHSLVGTLKTNKPAIALYKKMGYRPTFELVDFEKSLM